MSTGTGLLRIRERYRHRVRVQVVAFPQEGILRRPERRRAWEEAVAMGCDAVGGIPHFERTTEEGWRSVRLAFDLAEKHGAMLDFHCDETDDPGSRNLEVVCAEALDRCVIDCLYYEGLDLEGCQARCHADYSACSSSDADPAFGGELGCGVDDDDDFRDP